MKTWCWGANTEAQLADTTRVSRSAPAVTIDEMVGMPAGGPAISVALGFEHTCDLRSDARMRCAGSDSDGQIGIGPTAGDVVRLTEVSALTGVRQITSGGAHTCAVIDDGSLHCWGRNMEGQLGIDTTDDATMPVHVSSLADVAFASAGRNHTCAIAGGTLHCWGDNAENQLGVGDADPHLSPTPVTIPGDPPVVRVSAGDRHSCAVTLAGDLYCWGANESNQLGTGEVDPLGAPEAPIAIPGPVADVVAGTRHTCALTMPGDVYCWGDNRAGQLGTGSTSAPIAEPTRVAF
jgi:alpha-tubulin suppressor-like RCC1 family protein